MKKTKPAKKVFSYVQVNLSYKLPKAKSSNTVLGYSTLHVHSIIMCDGYDVGVVCTTDRDIITLLNDDYNDFSENYILSSHKEFNPPLISPYQLQSEKGEFLCGLCDKKKSYSCGYWLDDNICAILVCDKCANAKKKTKS